MPQLIIMRHAQADASFSGADFGRPLTDIGRQQALRQASWMQVQQLQPQLVVCSPATRTRDTALIVADTLGLDVRHGHLVQKIYEATAGDLIDVLEASATAEVALMIGHNPGVSALASLLIGEYLTMMPASVALLQLTTDPARRWDPASAELSALQHA